MLPKTGIPTSDDLEKVIPPEERLKKGPVAIVECFTKIPCDPCYHSCPVGAFSKFADINDIPKLDYNKCTGCGMCIAQCPGLAIFVVDYTFSEDRGIVRIPYEYLPLPVKGQEVIALNRAGENVGKAIVEKIQTNPSFSKTNIIWLSVPKDQLMEVRNFRVGDSNDG